MSTESWLPGIKSGDERLVLAMSSRGFDQEGNIGTAVVSGGSLYIKRPQSLTALTTISEDCAVYRTFV